MDYKAQVKKFRQDFAILFVRIGRCEKVFELEQEQLEAGSSGFTGESESKEDSEAEKELNRKKLILAGVRGKVFDGQNSMEDLMIPFLNLKVDEAVIDSIKRTIKVLEHQVEAVKVGAVI